MKTVLITGATGFVGANLIHRLVTMPFDIHIVSRHTSDIYRIKDIYDSLMSYEVDLRDDKAVTALIEEVEPDVIFHLATHGAYPRIQKDFDAIMDTNVYGTYNLLSACMKTGFDCFIHTGSSSEYGVKSQPMKETDFIDPTDAYSIAKATATLICQSIAKKDSLPITILRLFSVYGPYEASTRLIPTFIRACLHNEQASFFEPSAVRDFIYTEDVIDAYLKIMEKPAIGEIFNVGYGEQHTVTEVLKFILKHTDKTVFQFDKLNEVSQPKTWVSDNTKIKDYLNWQPKYGLDEGLGKTVEWFQRNPEFLFHAEPSG